MSDTYRPYTAIKRALMQFYHFLPGSHRERHFNTLAALICGLAGSQRAHLSTIADHAPAPAPSKKASLSAFATSSSTTARPLMPSFCP